MRETMASLFLRRCGYRGSEPVVDPMCGSGTFVIEAAEIAGGLNPAGRGTSPSSGWRASTPAAWQRCAAKVAGDAGPGRVFTAATATRGRSG